MELLTKCSDVNQHVSLRAVGLLAFYNELQKVPPAQVVASVFPEGRDAIRTAMKELQDNGYIKVERSQINGQWRTNTRLTSKGKEMKSAENGFSGPLTTTSN
jgi:hypothetical protein